MNISSNQSNSKVPHLFVLGAQKGGTTWLQHVLDCDKRFYCPPIRQEIHFFDEFWDQGMAYYKDLYTKATAQQILVDVSPEYISVPDTSKRIAEFAKESERPFKFILICREPVSRLASAYKMKVKQGADFKSLRDAIQKDSTLIDMGLYNKNLSRYFENFKQEDFLLLFFEDFLKDSNRFLAQIQSFLNLNEPIVNSYENIKVNAGGTRKIPIIDEVIRFGGRSLRKLGLTKLIHEVKRNKMMTNLQKFNEIPFELTTDDKDYLKEMKSKFTEDVTALSELADRADLHDMWAYDKTMV